ncbi:hypothetical protein M3Y98_00655900 [Aphelenchoides besseyi]|nr:hypothetical protein M3Y98_00655900 [Aphelenchoides besseyi]KAI6208732.1 hypothetical protein M3Y96_00146100 [Aphelenchoides besseyi]
MLSYCSYAYVDETICRWHVTSFKKQFQQAVSGDRWASDVFCIAEPDEVYIRFYLVFYPHGHIGSKSKTSSLYVKLVDLDQCSPYEYEARAWIESGGMMCSKTLTAVVQPGRVRTICGWKSFVPYCDLYKMLERSPDPNAYICYEFPRLAKLEMCAFPCTTVNVRWQIDHFAERYKNAKVGESWKSERIMISDYQDTYFCFVLYPKGETKRHSSWCSLYFRVENETDEEDVGLRYEMWIENEKGERKHSIAEAYVYFEWTPWKQARYIKREELRKFGSYGSLFVSCNFCRMLVPKMHPSLC